MLRDVLESFESYGTVTPAVAEQPVEPLQHDAAPVEDDHEPEEEDEYQEEYEEPKYYFDPTDIQGAVDQAISSLIKEELIPEFKTPKKPPTLTEVFTVLFGAENELTKQADYFEELISGYEDRAHVDDLREAYEVLESIIEAMTPRHV